MTTESLADAETRMKKSADALARELSAIRTGRANPALVEDIQVEYGGATYPINQLAQIAATDARLLTIQPWDPGSIPNIEKAIQASDVGIMPGNDGKLIRLPIPTLTEERRKDLVRTVKKRVEEGKIATRNVRRDVQDQIRKLQKEGDISEDEARRAQDDLQKATDRSVATMEELGSRKEEEMMAV
ncbi:MAG: ribosome recycling factor [Chloroflexi bacterium]|nr:ribosome recycling factor [Chloroflexota bacterium]